MSKSSIKRKKIITLPDTATSVVVSFRAVNRKGRIKHANKTVIPKGAETVVVRISKTKEAKEKAKPAVAKKSVKPAAPKVERKPTKKPKVEKPKVEGKKIDNKKVINYIYRKITDSKRENMKVIHYRNGYLYATDGYVLAKFKSTYDKSFEGKSFDKKGQIVETKLPDYNLIFSKNATETANLKGLIIRAGNKPTDKIAKVADNFYVNFENLSLVLSLFEMLGEKPSASVLREGKSAFKDKETGFLFLKSKSLTCVLVRYLIL